MAEPRFADDDDLPRTLRRERDARERELRERDNASFADEKAERQSGPHAGSTPAYAYDYGPAGSDGGVTVTRLAIPFTHLMMFFMKAVVAAIPALIVMALVFWGAGEALRFAVPSFKGIHITVWQAHGPAPTTEKIVEMPKPVSEPKKR